MKVDIWSDFVCPFCYIGKAKFEQALAQFEHRDQVEVIFRSFELAPDLPRDGNPNVYDMLTQKYGMSYEQAVANSNSIEQRAREVGIEINFAKSIQTNTFDAHRLAHYAATEQLQIPLTERLFKAHFTEGLHVGDHDTLANLAAEVGLSRDDVLTVLQSDQYAAEVRQDENKARAIGARAVPTFLFNNRVAITGAQESDVFLETLQNVWHDQP